MGFGLLQILAHVYEFESEDGCDEEFIEMVEILVARGCDSGAKNVLSSPADFSKRGSLTIHDVANGGLKEHLAHRPGGLAYEAARAATAVGKRSQGGSGSDEGARNTPRQ